MLKSFEDYMVDLLVESVKNKETYLILSPSFSKILTKIDHPISDKLLDDSNSEDTSFKITYINIDSSGDDKVSFISVPKASELLDNRYGFNGDVPNDAFRNFNYPDREVYTKNRMVTSVGKLITKLYGKLYPPSGKPGEDIESFTTLYKSFRNETTTFELVSGLDINYWYLEDNYSDEATDDDTILGNSCMKYESCQEFIDFYSKNPDNVSLLILKDPDDNTKIIGRSLVWKLDIPENRIFMDRIYTVNYEDIQLFKNYAIEHGWLYKEKQSYEYHEILDPLNKVNKNVEMVVNNMSRNEYYPYMDTLQYYNSDVEILSNSITAFRKINVNLNINTLRDTDGDPSTIYSEHYDDYFIIDDLIYCEFGDDNRKMTDCVDLPYYDQYATKEYFDDNIVKCEYHNNNDDIYLDKSDAIYLDIYDQYMSPNYEWKKLFIENDDHFYIKKKDSVYSQRHMEFLYKGDAVKVFTNIKKTSFDWRLNSDVSYFEDNGEYFDNKLKK